MDKGWDTEQQPVLNKKKKKKTLVYKILISHLKYYVTLHCQEYYMTLVVSSFLSQTKQKSITRHSKSSSTKQERGCVGVCNNFPLCLGG